MNQLIFLVLSSLFFIVFFVWILVFLISTKRWVQKRDIEQNKKIDEFMIRINKIVNVDLKDIVNTNTKVVTDFKTLLNKLFKKEYHGENN